ncbi:MAG: TonB-dependent receptor [Bacteroidales bacterium]|nr:TonB-dependent receptor [Bacteroidales bacterium]
MRNNQKCNFASCRRLFKSLLLLMAMLSVFTVDAWAQATIKGKVSDESGEPLPGANVVVKGTTIGTISDFDGNFVLSNVPEGNQTISVSFMGYQTLESDFVFVSGSTIIRDFPLVEDNEQLDEVVVVGYGVQKKKLVTGATVEVKGDDIQKMNTTQVLGALQSQSPGVNIQSNSGQPGDGFKISIRGAGTNGSTAPIYVIDGVAGGDINSLNPADIERIDVLKDAASCAIYGSSSANGVILITTKQGKAGKVQVTYDGSIGWSDPYKLPDMLTAKEYMEIMDLTAFNQGKEAYDWSKYIKDEELLAAYQNGSNKGTDWIGELLNEHAVTTSHAVNVTGGNDVSNFSTGLGYQYQDGVFGGPVKSDYKRFTFRLNSEHILWKGSNRDIIKFGENFYFQHKQNQGIQIGNQYSNLLSTALRANPLVPVYNKDGELFMHDDIAELGLFDYNLYSSNPIAYALNTQSGNNKSKNFNMNSSFYVDVQPIKNLTYKGLVSYKNYSSSWRAYTHAYYLNDQGEKVDEGSDAISNNLSLGWNWSATNTINYKFDLASDNHFDVLVGTEYSKSRPGYGENVDATAKGNVFSKMDDSFDYAYLHNASANKSAVVDGYPASYGSKVSYFGRINYDFNEFLMFSAVFRADGSSKFSKDNQWGYFPSFAAGWVMSNMDFMSSVNWVSFLKLRASWGQNGNDNISTDAFTSGWTFGDFGPYSFGNNKNSATKGAYKDRLANPDLTWETSEQTNIGIDARFLNSKLSLTADWYNKTTKDLLVAVDVNALTGFTSQIQNAGTVKNTGIELSLGYQDKIGKEFTYSVNWNMAFNKNEVTEVKNSNKYIEGGKDLLAQSTGYIARMEEGYSIGYFYGYKTDGVIQNEADLKKYLDDNCGGDVSNSLQGKSIAPGDLKFVDTNGDGVITSDDKTDIGHPTPDFTTGLSLNFGYKGFDLSCVLYGAFGHQIARSYRKFSDGEKENYTSEVYDYWFGENTSNVHPILTIGSHANTMNISDIYIENADYVRMQNLTLGYDFKHLWKSCNLQQIRFYFSALNLFTITGYKGMDPENGIALNSNEPWVTGVDVGNYPNPRTFLFGVNIKF